jgi:predicted CXXCH cytochrome family protein
MRPGLAAATVLAILLAGAVAAAGARQMPQEVFPHPLHERLFPACQGCHAGVETGEADRLYPSPDRCGACHDGERVREVSWTGPGRAPSNLRFSHLAHVGRPTDAGDPVSCQTCHRPAGAQGRMTVSRATPDRCATCHAHEALDHPNGGQACTVCHRALTDVPDLPAARIAAFPQPSDHGEPGFLSAHGPAPDAARATCATCHARPSCERCHVNAGALPAVQALAPDLRVQALAAGLVPEYPTPASHDGGWIQGHGRDAGEGPEACANCHGRPSCLTCHREGGTAALAALFVPLPGGPTGVVIDATEARDRLHPPDFERGHGSAAATRGDDCQSCHTEPFCTGCHAGPETPSFHPVNFLETHGSRAYGADTECVTCHNPELFCRSCHAGVGLASSGRLNAGFHDAQPFWLLGHGQAARQNLAGCVTCHGQTDCASCHSPLGGWGVSPHGPGFEASRFLETASTGCILCHRGGLPGG